MGLVEIVNPNGQKGLVADTSDAALLYDRPPSAREDSEPADVVRETVLGDPAAAFTTPVQGLPPAPAAPPKNASADDWRTYAVTVHGAQPDEVADLTRDELIELYDTPTSTGSDNGQEA